VNRHGLEKLPKASRWLQHVEAAFSHRQPLNEADGPHAEICSVIRGNVVAQLLNLKAQPSVGRAMREGRLEVHGWYYDILSGRIEQFDEDARRFVPLV
jgi:carbonic anhydrase